MTMKYAAFIAAASLAALSLAACTPKNTEQPVPDEAQGTDTIALPSSDSDSVTAPRTVEVVNAAITSDTSLVSAASVMAHAADVTDRAYVLDFFHVDDTEKVLDRLENGSLDMAYLPLDAVIENCDTLSVMAVSAKGDYVLAETENALDTLSDLTGKTVFLPGNDARASTLFYNLLRLYEFTEENDITVVTQKNEADCLASLLATPDSAAVLSMTTVRPAITEENGLRAAFDLSGLWEKEKQVTTVKEVLAVSRSFLVSHGETVSDICQTLSAAHDAVAAAEYLETLGFCGAVAAGQLVQSERYAAVCGDAMRTLIENDMTVRGAVLVEDDAFYFGAASRKTEE